MHSGALDQSNTHGHARHLLIKQSKISALHSTAHLSSIAQIALPLWTASAGLVQLAIILTNTPQLLLVQLAGDR